MKIFKYLSFVAAALLFAACSSDDDEGGSSDEDSGGSSSGSSTSTAILISPVLTRVTDTSFEEGDMIGVSITTTDGAYATNARFTYSGSTFSGSVNWYDDSSMSSSFTAYYPYKVAGVPSTFTVETDQSDGISDSDFIVGAKTGVTPSSSAIVVPFVHLLSKLVLDVDNQSGSDISSIELSGSATTASVSVSGQTASASSSSGTGTITAYEVTAGSEYNAIIVPQTVALGLTVNTSDGKELVQELASYEFAQGSEYTLAVTVYPDDIDVTITGVIGGWNDQGSISLDDDYVSFTEYDGYFEYDGATYNTITLSNGSTWMAEPLRYVPGGYTPSSDSSDDSAHIWYPYETDGTNTTALTASTSVKSKGYLYDLLAVFGTDSIDDSNAASFEGCQGICPEGWHIPTRAEFFALCGNSNKSTDEDATQYDESALFYDSDYKAGRIGLFNDGGWNFVMSGARMKSSFSGTGKYQATVTKESTCSVEDWIGLPALTYIATSTYYKSSEGSNCQFFVGMTTFTSTYPAGKVSLAYGHYETGMQVRCVKDSE